MANRSETFDIRFKGKDQSVGRTLKGLDNDMGKFSRSAGKFAVGVAGAFAAAFAVDKLIDFGAELFDLGNQVALWDSKVSTVFGENADDVRAWADSVNEDFGLADEQVASLAANMADVLGPALGATNDEATAMSQAMVGAAPALALWSGGTYDAAQVSEIMTKALLGEFEQLKSMGIVLNAARVETAALAIAQADGREEVTAMDKALAIQTEILGQSTNALENWDSAAADGVKQQNELKAKWADLKVELAEGFMPIAAAVTAWLVDDAIPALEQFRDWVGPRIRAALDLFSAWWTENGPGIIGFMESIRSAAVEVGQGILAMWAQYGQPALTALVEAFGNLMGSLDELGGTLEESGVDWELLGKAIGGVALFLGTGLTVALNRTADMLDDVTTAINAVKSAWQKLKDLVQGGINWPSPPSWLGRINPFGGGGGDSGGGGNPVYRNAAGSYVTSPRLSWIGEGTQNEFILNASQMRGLAREGISVGGNSNQGNVVVNVQGSILSENDLAGLISRLTSDGRVGAGLALGV